MSRVPAEYCPVSIAATVLCERWNLLIVRELVLGARGFNDIHRGLPGLSRTLLSQRLRVLQQAGVLGAVTADGSGRQGYELTPKGVDLESVLEAIGAWSVRWSFPEPADDQLDPLLLMWRMRSGLELVNLPRRRVTVELLFEQAPGPVRGWLVLDGVDSSVCVHDPLFGVDVHARASSRVWHELWYGHRRWSDAIGDGELELSGEADLVEAFPTWFALSALAPQVTRERSGAPDTP